jgi:hypothetical protein
MVKHWTMSGNSITYFLELTIHSIYVFLQLIQMFACIVDFFVKQATFKLLSRYAV